MEDTWTVFNKLPPCGVVTWNVMMFGLVKCGQRQKQCGTILTNATGWCVTVGGVPNACASIVALEEGRPAHKQIVESGKDSDVFDRSSLVDMYAKCGSMEEALRVFNELPS
jgi:pentatricopeptide repeat protein